MQWMFLIVFYTTTADGGSTEQLSEIRTAFLQKYKSYHDVGLMQFEVPRESAYVRFEFTADDAIPGCKIEKVLLYIKHNSPPVINPDGSKFPSDFKKIARPKTYYLEATGNTTDYLVVSPYFGYYYVSAVLPYVDPKYTPVQPPGLTRECKPFVQGRLLWSSRTILSITEVTVYRVFIFFPMCRFYIPEDVSHVTLFIDDLKLFNTTKYVVVRVQAGSFPSQEHSVKNLTITTNTTAAIMRFNTKGSQWYYLKFYFNERIFSFQEWSKLKFTLKYFHEISRENLTSSRIFSSDQINQVISYQLYNLVMDSSTESFSYFYRMYSFNSNNINVNSTHFVALQFKVRPQTDIGGTLRFQLSFESGRNDLQVIACIRPGELEVPTWPNLCVHNDGRNDAPLVLNATMTESSMLIPFPEAGVWFATFRLFCGECAPCRCPESCQNEFKECLDKCESTCIFSECNNCTVMCKIEVLHKAVCEQCDCDGPCIRHDDFCNSTVTFDIGSTSCVDSCGPHGRCMLFVGDGVVYASCLCLNNYRGK
ncbi:hypothetical protein BDFB_003004 [Asbolus verrucosus]|uniref:Uncharacterized protein n=1 Tax=Asbolus verrucosus TaxID=1661398 RepID=A0A482W0X8_ASBVE|nr:hypothetical protein BDFB_003004 [Asbolus verrucosus]